AHVPHSQSPLRVLMGGRASGIGAAENKKPRRQAPVLVGLEPAAVAGPDVSPDRIICALARPHPLAESAHLKQGTYRSRAVGETPHGSRRPELLHDARIRN